MQWHGIECGSATLPISVSGSSRQSSNNHVITVSEDEVRRALKRVNVRKAAGPDGITARVLRSCADQLAGLFTSIFTESLATSVVPTSFKKSVIIRVPKKSSQVTFIYIALLTIQIVSKHLTVSSWRIECQ